MNKRFSIEVDGKNIVMLKSSKVFEIYKRRFKRDLFDGMDAAVQLHERKKHDLASVEVQKIFWAFAKNAMLPLKDFDVWSAQFNEFPDTKLIELQQKIR